MSTTVHKHKTGITRSGFLIYGHHGTEEGGYLCTSICVSLFHVNHEKREMCMYVRQVLNGVSYGT